MFRKPRVLRFGGREKGISCSLLTFVMVVVVVVVVDVMLTNMNLFLSVKLAAYRYIS